MCIRDSGSHRDAEGHRRRFVSETTPEDQEHDFTLLLRQVSYDAVDHLERGLRFDAVDDGIIRRKRTVAVESFESLGVATQGASGVARCVVCLLYTSRCV